MTKKTDDILEQLKTLNALAISELVKQIENTFGVNASAKNVHNWFDFFQ